MGEVWDLLTEYPIYAFYLVASVFCALSCGYFLSTW